MSTRGEPLTDLQFILDAIRKDRRDGLFIGPILLAIGVAFALVPIGDHGPVLSVLYRVVMVAIGLAVAWAGVASILPMFRRPEAEPGVQVLVHQPARIVWAHVKVQTRYGQTQAAHLVLGTEDGKRLPIAVPKTDDEQARALALVHQRAPRATLGFSPDLDNQFDRDPASLRTT